MVELYEIALSDDGFVFGPFTPFEPGDVRDLAPFVKFRVTVYGDFDTDDYRQRGFAGISDDATLVEGGFGLSPFGRFPFGDGGVCIDDGNTSNLVGSLSMSASLVAEETGFSDAGSVSMSGSLTIEFTKALSGSTSMSGALLAEVVEAVSGSLSMSGTLIVQAAVQETLSGSMSMSGSLSVEVLESLSGSAAASGTLSVLVSTQESGSLSMSGNLQAVLQGSHLQLLSNVGRNAVPFRGAGTQTGESAIRGTIFRNSRE